MPKFRLIQLIFKLWQSSKTLPKLLKWWLKFLRLSGVFT